jgi:hypothetical protein
LVRATPTGAGADDGGGQVTKAVRGQKSEVRGNQGRVVENTVPDSVLEKSKKTVQDGVGAYVNSSVRVREMGRGS